KIRRHFRKNSYDVFSPQLAQDLAGDQGTAFSAARFRELGGEGHDIRPHSGCGSVLIAYQEGKRTATLENWLAKRCYSLSSPGGVNNPSTPKPCSKNVRSSAGSTRLLCR